ncbi:MAG: tyrosine-protein kinase domain-containing protein [Solirubrobacteraceae bacterium]
MQSTYLPQDNKPAILWRRKWIVLTTLLAFVLATELVTKTLTRVYQTSATLLVAQPGRTLSFETVQANEEVARSYATIFVSTNFAARVASRIGGGATGSSVAAAITITPISETQLFTIAAEDPSRSRAQQLANTYAAAVIAYAPTLTQQTNATVTLADPAPLPGSPVRPKPLLYGLIAAILGLAAGIALAFLRERYDVRLRSLDEIAAHVDLPIIADIPQRTGKPGSIAAFAEAFRLLRTNLRLLDQTGSVRSIAVTSWTASEGKTTVASQLALTLAASGDTTLIVDGDPRNAGLQSWLIPTAHGILAPGLSDYALGAATLEAAIYETRIPSIMLMPKGRPVPSLSSLLDTRQSRVLFDNLNAHGDAVVADCPPLSLGADAPTIAARVDGVILVVDVSKATTTALRNSVRQLQAVNAVILGIAINRDRDRGSIARYVKDGEAVNGSGPRSIALIERARAALSRR